MNSEIFVNTDSRIVLRGLKDRSGALVSGAVVTLEQFTDRQGNPVSGLTLPATFSFVSGGDYELLVSNSIGVVAEKRYYAVVRASFSGLRREWRESVICRHGED